MIAIIIIRVIILFNNILAPQKDRKCIFTQISWGLFYLFGDWHDITTWGRYRKRQAGGVEAPTERNPNHQLVTMGMPMKHWWNFNGQDIHHLLVTCGFRHFYHRFEKGHLAIFKGRVTLGHIPCPPSGLADFAVSERILGLWVRPHNGASHWKAALCSLATWVNGCYPRVDEWGIELISLI